MEELRRRAIGDAEKKYISVDQGLNVAIGAEVTRTTLHLPHEATSQQVDAQQTGPRQNLPEKTVPQPNHQPPVSKPVNPKRAIPQPTVSQQVNRQSAVPQRTTVQSTIPQPGTPQQETSKVVVPQQTVALHERQPPAPASGNIFDAGPITVKAEHIDEDQLDFAFVAKVLLDWKPDKEGDAALWKRLETTVGSQACPSGDVES